MEQDERQQLFIYERGVSIMRDATTRQQYLDAISHFAQVSDFRDSAELMTQCIELSESVEKDGIYNKAIDTMKGDSIDAYTQALSLFDTIPEWRDSKEQMEFCKQQIDVIGAKKAKKKRRIIIIIASVVAVILIAIVSAAVVIGSMLNSRYEEAEQLYKDGKHVKAYEIYVELGSFNDSEEKVEEIRKTGKTLARQMADKGQYKEAYELLADLKINAKEYPLMSAYKSAKDGDYKNAVKNGLTEIIIPEGVFEIKADTFLDCKELKKVTFPKSIRAIGSCAFYGCTYLETVVFPEKCALATIGESAFEKCSSIKEITIPANVKSIGKRAFAGCTWLTKAKFMIPGFWCIKTDGMRVDFEWSEMSDPTFAAKCLTVIGSEVELTRRQFT